MKLFNKKNQQENINQSNDNAVKTPAKEYRIRNLKLGWMAAAITVIFIAVIIIINIILSVVDNRFSLDLDMTSDKAFTMSDETADFIKNIDKQVDIKIFIDEDTFKSGLQSNYGNDAVKTAFENSVKLNNNISLQYIDLNLTPNIAGDYNTSNISNGYYIVFECGDKKEYLSDFDFYVFGTDPTTGTYYDSNYQPIIDGDQIERVMVQKMMAVTSDKSPVAALISGHDDVGAEYFIYIAQQMGVSVEEISLVTEDIPEEASLAIIPAPMTDYSQGEIDKLNGYLQRKGSGNIVIFNDASQSKLPNFEAFIKKWGIELHEGVLNETDASNYISGEPGLFSVDVDSTVDSFASALTGRPILSYMTRPMHILFEENDGILVESLINTRGTAGIVDSEGKVYESEIYPVLTHSYCTDLGGADDEYDNVYIYASVNMFDQELLSYYSGAINNENLAQDTITVTTTSDVDVNIPERNFTSRTMNINQLQAITIGLFIFTMLLPVTVLIIGFALWFRRRRL